VEKETGGRKEGERVRDDKGEEAQQVREPVR
jgi:hypothetical protein